jgi:hypothetical protein
MAHRPPATGHVPRAHRPRARLAGTGDTANGAPAGHRNRPGLVGIRGKSTKGIHVTLTAYLPRMPFITKLSRLD